MTRCARQVVIQHPYQVVVRTVTLPFLGPDDVLVKTWGSAISTGTELLFYRGQVPDHMAVDTTIAGLSDRVSYPLHYGYACVGTIIEVGSDVDPARIGQRVFGFQPHADYFAVPQDTLLVIPETIGWEQALLLPNMETAVNLVMDAHPVLGERVVVFGQGVVGLLTTFLLQRFPLESLTVVEGIMPRRELAQTWGAHHTYAPDTWEAEADKQADLYIEVSSNPAALAAAVRHAPYGARVIVGSWYGTKTAALDLGGSFHRNRITVQSSQVSTIGPQWQPRWDKARRFALVWRCLADLPTEDLITHRLPASQADAAFNRLDTKPDTTLQVILTYT